LINRRRHAARERHTLLEPPFQSSCLLVLEKDGLGLKGGVLVANLVAAEGEIPFEEMRRIARAVEAHAATSRSATSAPGHGSSLSAYARAAGVFTFDTSSHPELQ
jgi:hypothetical protein